MKEMVAVCELDCYECGAFLATKENYNQKRTEVAQEYLRLSKVEIKVVVVARPKGVAISL